MVVDDEVAAMKAAGFTQTPIEDNPPTPSTEPPTPPAASAEPPKAADAPPIPPTDTPAAEPTLKFAPTADVPPAPVADEFDSEKYFGVKLEKAEIQKRITEYEKVQNELSTLKNTNPFANDEVKRFNEAMSKGVTKDAFFKVDGVDIEKLTPLEKVVTQLMWQKGLTEEKAKLLVNHKYSLDAVADELASDTEKAAVEKTKELANLQLEMDAKDAGEFLSQFKVKTLSPPPPPAYESKVEETWKPHLPEIVKGFGTMEIGGFKYDVPKTVLEDAEKEIMATLKYMKADNALPTNPEDVANIKEMVESHIKAKSFDSFAKAIVADFGTKMLTFKNNPSGLKSEANQESQRQNGSGSTAAMIKEIMDKGY